MVKNCPVKHCAARTREKIALIVAGVMTLVAITVLVLHFFPQLNPMNRDGD